MIRAARRLPALALVALAAFALAASTATATGGDAPGSLYTQTNDPAGNRVQVIAQSPGGALTLGRSYPTGGLGTGGGLSNQGSVVLAKRWLLATNAGSDELSIFRVGRRGLILTDVVPSGGDQPVSVTSDGATAYVVNAGGSGNVSGFAIADDGRLTPIAGSSRPLSAAGAGPAEIERSPDGGTLVVTERLTNRIDTYPLAADGSVGAPTITPSAGETPFGFAFDGHGRLFVADAFGGVPNASAMSSYALVSGGGVTAIDPVEKTLQTAACWVALSPDQRFAYTTNTGSNSITGYRIAKDGGLSRLDTDGVTATTGAGPTDMAVGGDGRHLFALNAADGTISGFRLRKDGGLDPAGTLTGLPAGAVTGLAAR